MKNTCGYISFYECYFCCVSEGNLRNPAIFENQDNVSWDLALEYLDIVDQYPCPMTYMRGHMFKLFHHV